MMQQKRYFQRIFRVSANLKTKSNSHRKGSKISGPSRQPSDGILLRSPERMVAMERVRLASKWGPVSGFVIRAADGPLLYLAGDTLWCPEVEDTLSEYGPDVVVVNTGEAQFVESDPITMAKEGVAEVCRAVPEATVIAVHMNAINHCLLSRTDLRSYLTDQGLENQVKIPADGEWV